MRDFYFTYIVLKIRDKRFAPFFNNLLGNLIDRITYIMDYYKNYKGYSFIYV